MSDDAERLGRVLERMESMGADIAEMRTSMSRMADGISRLAVIEERQSTDRAEIGRLFKRQDDHEGRIVTLERAQPMQQRTTDWVDRATWIVVSMVLTALVGLVLVGRGPSPQLPTPLPPPVEKRT